MAIVRAGVVLSAVCITAALAAAPSASAAPGEVTITIGPSSPVENRATRFTAQVDPPTGTRVAANGFSWSVRSGGGGWTALPGHDRRAQHTFTTAGPKRVRVVVSLRSRQEGAPAPASISAEAEFTVSEPQQPPPTPRPEPEPEPSPTPEPSPAPVANRAPTAFIRAYPGAPRPWEPVELISVARDSDGSIVRESWDLDNDGAFDDASGSVVSYRFPSPGLRVVSLRVVDSRGAAATAFLTVDVRRPTLARRLLSPFPLVRLQGRLVGSGVRITLLQVRAGRGAIVKVSCRGTSCPYRGRRASISRSQKLRVRGLERFLRAGTRIKLRVTKPGRIGKYTTFRIRRNGAPVRSDSCISHKANKPRRCPAS